MLLWCLVKPITGIGSSLPALHFPGMKMLALVLLGTIDSPVTLVPQSSVFMAWGLFTTVLEFITDADTLNLMAFSDR